MHYYISALKKYATFSGRARRSEYWYFVLFSFLVTVILNIISRIIGDGNDILSGIYGLAVLIPSISVAVRRLHDTGRSGWWILINLIPVIGWIWFIVLMLIEGDAEANKYGQNPKGEAGVESTKAHEPAQAEPMAEPAPASEPMSETPEEPQA